MGESKWHRMKRKAYERGLSEGRYQAFCEWDDGKVGYITLSSFRISRSMRDRVASDLMYSRSAAPIAGIRFEVGNV